MAKSVFKAGREKAERRKLFKSKAEEAEFAKALRQAEIEAGFAPPTGDVPQATDRNIFKKGRAKAERRKKFTKEATKAGRKEGARRITKNPDTKPKTLKRGRRKGQTTGKKAGDESKAELYKKAMAIKKASKGTDKEIKGNMGAMSKKELQAFILKHDDIMVFT